MPNYKGFDKDLKCIGFQYEIGKEYEIDEKPIRCTNSGFHSCEHPLDVLGYYEPGDSRYCEVEVDGQIDKDNSDTKVASSKIKIGAEIGFLDYSLALQNLYLKRSQMILIPRKLTMTAVMQQPRDTAVMQQFQVKTQ